MTLLSASSVAYLQCKQVFSGDTGYIDNIRAYDVIHPVCIGIDFYSRPFITFKKDSKVLCVFQRYSTDRERWTTWVACHLHELTGGMNVTSYDFAHAFHAWYGYGPFQNKCVSKIEF